MFVCGISEYNWREDSHIRWKSPNKQLAHTFVHFVVRLQSRFYTLTPISVFYVNISSSSLRFFTINPFLSFLPATHRQYFILVLSLPLRRLRVTFVLNISIALKELFFQAIDITKRLSIKVFVIL